MDICSVPTFFVWCSVLLPSFLIIVCIIFGIFYHCFVVNRQIDLGGKAVCKSGEGLPVFLPPSLLVAEAAKQ